MHVSRQLFVLTVYISSSFITHQHDRSSPLFKGDPELAAAVSSFRGWAANAEAMAEKYKAAPAPVDFAKAKSAVRDQSLVDALEALYKNNKPPAETYEWSTEDRPTRPSRSRMPRAALPSPRR